MSPGRDENGFTSCHREQRKIIYCVPCTISFYRLKKPPPAPPPGRLREKRTRMDTKERAAADFPLHIGQMIRREMLRQQRSVSWLAEQIPCDRRNIYHIFRRPNIDSGLLLKLSLILHTDFFRFYSAYLADTQVVTTPPHFTLFCAGSRRGGLPCAA